MIGQIQCRSGLDPVPACNFKNVTSNLCYQSVMIGTDILDWLPVTVLYAETHYRFRFFPFSLYFRRQPEIVFDAPYRLEPDQPLPITLIVKDADRFPVTLSEVILNIKTAEKSLEQRIQLGTTVSQPFWHRIFDIDVSELPSGIMSVDATAVIESFAFPPLRSRGGVRGGKLLRKCRRKRIVVRQDNCVGLSHSPLKVFKADDSLPNFPNWYAGELHCHTDYGCDQVEFGAPLPSYQRTAKALGLDWVALTDHSYNLDDLPDDYLHSDPKLVQWHRLHEETKELNRNSDVILIPGEELTCRSAQGRNVHLLILGEPTFLHGSGDGAERWFRTRSELSVEEALHRINPESFAVAAHPLVKIPLLERLLVGRGEWQPSNLQASRLDGWQILNGQWENDFHRGLTAWIESLERGERRYIFAGNDAHGNFNRFRQVSLPMVKLWERDQHLFGRATTRVKVDGILSEQSILSNLKAGHAIISDGPALELVIVQDGREIHVGDEAFGDEDGENRRPIQEYSRIRIRYRVEIIYVFHAEGVRCFGSVQR
ncbi:MAG: CehA/McbA family metallohydrolase [Candidatus Electryoneaceae bacterium]|nr:CehA/McbA family metallohydrolase [Candidatus Electryoneaceae bacterium]